MWENFFNNFLKREKCEMEKSFSLIIWHKFGIWVEKIWEINVATILEEPTNLRNYGKTYNLLLTGGGG